MKKIEVYENGEKVFIKAEVRGISMEGNDISYKLYDPKSGHDYDLMYAPEELHPIGEEHEMPEVPDRSN